MIEILCNSCHTRYRIDEQVLPEETPTFKCSRCGHVFTVEPRESKSAAMPASRPEREQSDLAPRDTPQAPPQQREDFFSQPFAEDDAFKAGDNPRFDFRDEEASADEGRFKDRVRTEEPRSPQDWAAGEDANFDLRRTAEEPRQEEGKSHRRAARIPGLRDDQFVNDEAAPIYNRGVTHSGRFFATLCLLVGIGFAGMTALIHNAPAAAADILSRFPVIGPRFEQPMTPARIVALRDVRSGYQRSKDGKPALVITGVAENVGLSSLHVVQIAARLRDSNQRVLPAQAVYCGNNLSSKMVGEMTPHEIGFFQKLDPPKSFVLEPSGTCPFVIVFIDPPGGVNRFDISVARAVPAPSETTAASGS
jgi:predicted Zn finger-like uncharacterized protein